MVLTYLGHISRYSRAQVTRLVSRWVAGKLLVKQYRAPELAFAKAYTAVDMALLAEVDQAMGTLSGPATACALRRQGDVYADVRFALHGPISVGHLYNLRNSAPYRAKRIVKNRTVPVKAVKIGVRRAPAPEGRTGFNRIDSVHQGDLDGVKGVYHINAFKCFTQWVVVATVQGLSEAFLLPVIAHMPSQFPFAPHGFHSYNGSEYVNRDVAAMLEKLHIEFTRGRPRCGNDYRLAETKNGAVIRKLFGTDLIPQRHAVRFDTFCCEQLNPLLNFHRPCLFPTDRPDPKKPGRVKRVYRPQDATTPLTKLAAACLVPLAGEGGRVFRRRAGAAAAWASSSLLWCAAAREESRHRAVARYLWAMLLARIYEAFPPQCPICHSQMRILAFINDAGNLKKILDHIGESSQPLRIAPARGPPLWEASAAAEQADKDPQWDSSTQPALEIEFDQRIAW